MPHKLLLADDSVTIQRVIELTFADEDVHVAAVSDGDQAIARINAEPPDIVLADIGMPGKDGYEVAAHVKQTPWLAHIPVLLLTGAFEPVDQGRIVSIGCEGVLAKPFEPQQVISRVRELLGRRGGTAAAPPPTAAAAPTVAPAPAGIPAPAAPAVPSPAADPGGALDDYFDRLDAAFANAGGPAAPPAPADATAPTPAGSSLADQIDWYAAAPQQESVPPPVQAPAVPSAPAAPSAPASSPSAAAPVVRPTPPVPSLADAFSVLLAAEQTAGLPIVAPTWPSSTGAPAVDTGSVSEEVVQQITRRVLAELSNGVVRRAVAEVVSGVAEQLVREEIERIKAAVKP